MEEAISEVTLFLERIRRTVANSSRGRGRHNILYVTIITGSGSVSCVICMLLPRNDIKLTTYHRYNIIECSTALMDPSSKMQCKNCLRNEE